MAKMSEIGDWIGVNSLSNEQITEVSSIEAATEHSAIFATDGSSFAKALKSKAGLILAHKSLNISTFDDSRVWWVADPRLAFAVVAKRLKGKSFEAEIHPSAIIGEGVEIGAGVGIGPGVVIGDGVRIGNDCNILARVTIYSRRSWGIAWWYRRERC